MVQRQRHIASNEPGVSRPAKASFEAWSLNGGIESHRRRILNSEVAGLLAVMTFVLGLIHLGGTCLMMKKGEQKGYIDCSEGSKRVWSRFDRGCFWLGSKRGVCLRLLGSKSDSLRHRTVEQRPTRSCRPRPPLTVL